MLAAQHLKHSTHTHVPCIRSTTAQSKSTKIKQNKTVSLIKTIFGYIFLSFRFYSMDFLTRTNDCAGLCACAQSLCALNRASFATVPSSVVRTYERWTLCTPCHTDFNARMPTAADSGDQFDVRRLTMMTTIHDDLCIEYSLLKSQNTFQIIFGNGISFCVLLVFSILRKCSCFSQSHSASRYLLWMAMCRALCTDMRHVFHRFAAFFHFVATPLATMLCNSLSNSTFCLLFFISVRINLSSWMAFFRTTHLSLSVVFVGLLQIALHRRETCDCDFSFCIIASN